MKHAIVKTGSLKTGGYFYFIKDEKEADMIINAITASGYKTNSPDDIKRNVELGYKFMRFYIRNGIYYFGSYAFQEDYLSMGLKMLTVQDLMNEVSECLL